MSYPDINRDDFLQDLLARKEYYSLKADPVRNFRDPPEARHDPLTGKYLKIHSHQLFVRNFENPNTPYKKCHLMHSTGSGKTIAAITTAQEFVKMYKKMYASAAAKMPGRRHMMELDKTTPTVFVLGFGGTKAAFVRELLRHPEFGFITISEKEELVKRQKLAEAGLPDDIRQLRDYYNFLKKRITNKTKDGFYRFFGYQEFVNRLFLSDEVKLTDLEAQAIQKLRAGENVTLEDIIYQYIESGKIQVNTQLLQQFENSFLICDEIHNTYNMNMKNNYGVAIQFVLDSTPSMRALTMSATPINNSPTEVVELINYLVPKDQKITKREFFENSRTLRPGKLQRIGELSRGRFSYLQDISLKYFPRREFMGEEIIIPKDIENFRSGEAIPYLKFVECPMSEIHQATYFNYLDMVAKGVVEEPLLVEEESSERVPGVADQKEIIREREAESTPTADNIAITEDLNDDDEPEAGPYIDEETVDEPILGVQPTTKYSYHSIPTDGYTIYDLVYPNPESDKIGLFRSGETRNKIALASQEWKDRNKVMIKKVSAVNSVITGDFLLRENIGKWSTKNATLIDLIHQIIAESEGDPEKCQKIMIYHDRVKMSGVLQVQQLLSRNNMLDEYSEPVDTTICCVCGKPMVEHATSDINAETPTGHAFRPVRFVMAHSDIEKTTMEQSLARYNSPDNAHGTKFMILVGSKIIKESYDFKDIQNLIVMTLPINLPVFIQVLGRAIRKNSHINLPPEQRRVRVYTLLSTVNKKYPQSDVVSPEMYRVIDKLSDYIAIQVITREINRNALDADIHRDVNMPPELYKRFFPPGRDPSAGPVDMLGDLYFEPSVKVPEYKLSDLNLSTWNAYNYNDEEIKTISWIVKRLFMQQPVWTYENLWETVRAPPFGVEMNPKLFAEGNFVVALHNLVASATQVISASKQRQDLSELFLIERIFDYSERFIYLHGQRHKIEQVGRYYVLFPVATTQTNPLNAVYAEYLEHTRDRDRALFKQVKEPDEKVVVDVESYLRPLVYKPGVRINIDQYVRESKAGVNYASKRNQFLERYRGKEDITSFLTDYNADFQISILEEAILAQVLGAKSTDTSDELKALYKKLIELFDRFRVLVRLSEVRKYKDTVKQYKHGLPELPDDTPLGYMTSKSVRLYDPGIEGFNQKKANAMGRDAREHGRWFEVSKVAMNRHRVFKENEIIVGYFESAEDSMRFKLRRPAHIIKEDIAKEAAARKMTKSEVEGMSTSTRQAVGDTRLIERGIVCSTKNKFELLKIISNLGISTSRLDRSLLRIKRLCDIIRTRLLEKEAAERQKDSKYKYIYSWWDSLPSLTNE